jgi:hypothetical protein
MPGGKGEPDGNADPSDRVFDLPAQPSLRSCGNNASLSDRRLVI